MTSSLTESASPSSRTPMAGALMTAFATPALMFTAADVMAQNAAAVPQLSPVRVEGDSAPTYDVKSSASQKFTAPLLDTPKSVQIIPQELLQNQAASTLTEALRNSPGITFGAGEGGNPLGDRPFIRGSDAQSSTFIDGLRDIGATSREVFNLEQIEVIKGSDGAYGGRGGAGGSINLISKTPKAEDFNAASLAFGTDSYYRGTLDSNFALSDSTAFRLNAMYHNADVAGRDVVSNERWGIAPSLAFGLGTPNRATFSYYHLKTNDIPDGGIPYAYPSTRVTRTGSYMGITRTGPADVDRDNFYGLKSDYRRTNTDIGTIALEHDFTDKLTLRNTSRYTYSNQNYVWTQPDDSQGNVLNGKVWRRANTRSSDVSSFANQTELDGEFNTGAFKHTFLTGAEWSVENGQRDTLAVNRGTGTSCNAGIGALSRYFCTSLYNPSPSDPWVNTLSGERVGQPSKSRNTSVSLYAFDTMTLSEHWLLNGGLRLDDYRTKFTNTPANNYQVIRRDDTLVNYQAGVVYKPVETTSFYASFGTSSTPTNGTLGEGSETQGITPGRGGVGINAADLAPEKNKTYEVGTKWEVLDRRMSLTAALFRTETDNARITLPSGNYAMAGKRQVNGLELGVSGAITPKWQVFGGYTFMKSEIKDGGPAGTDEGNDFPQTPRNSLSLWSTYKVLPQFTVGGGAYYVDKQYGNTTNTTYIPSYWRFDAMAGYEVNRNLNLQLNVLNLFDKRYFDKAYPAHYANVAPGRAAIVSVNVKY